LAVDWASSPGVPHHRIASPEIAFNEATPSLELKALPEHLKYAYLSGKDTLPVIIASHLTEQQEDSLMSILKRHRKAIGWTMQDIKGISLAIVQHRIYLIDEATPKRDPQCRLNPLMQEAVKAEIMKLLDNGIIYPFLIANGLARFMRSRRKLTLRWLKMSKKSWYKQDCLPRFVFVSTIEN